MVATGAGLSAWIAFFLWTPAGDASICLLRRWWIPCPGCGMTRAAAHLAKGEWLQAWALHPMMIVLALEAVGLWLVWAVSRFRGGALGRRLIRRLDWTAWGLGHAALFLAVWLYRWITGQLPW